MNDVGPDNLCRLLVKILRCIFSWLASLFPKTSRLITFDTGRKVRMGRQIAEGGFSYVFEAFDAEAAGCKYALKRIHLGDPETLANCRKEAGLHRSVRHPNVMPLLGMVLEERNTVCYMLFPYMPHSLRGNVNRRFFSETPPHPWLEVTALELFRGILDGVTALHDEAHCTHRDLKLENILLSEKGTPVIMDFGSAGPLTQSIATRSDVLLLVEEAAVHTTISYRPPELLEGGVRAGDADVDFCKVDVWSLGCTLYAILYGASPFECEFRQGGGTTIRIVECTCLRILGELPKLPEAVQQWYSPDVMALISEMLTQDRMKRPGLEKVRTQVEGLIEKQGGRLRQQLVPAAAASGDDHPMDVLLGFV